MTDRAPLLLVVSHTHWDREWYKTAEQFRFGLTRLVDELVDAPRQFLLDGQAIVLDDYLGWRPERTSALASLLQAGTLQAGPWYVLADNLIPGGEALIRNLLAGRARLSSLGAAAPEVLYCPDSFGHPAAGPALAAGFGLPLAIVWRGYGGRGWPDGDSARWRGPGGDEVLLYHLPTAGYEHGSNLPSRPAEAETRWREIAATLGARSRSGVLLVLNGADHHVPQAALGEALAAARHVLPEATIRSATLPDFATAHREQLAARALPVVFGELRGSPGYVWSLQGTFGSRAAQKRVNAQVERLLTREVEPWAALAWWRSGAEKGAAAGERALWRLVLEGHPHDTLCGCSLDAVALAMDDRLRRARDGALELRRLALGRVIGLDPDAARPLADASDRAVLVTNPVARSRTGVVEAVVDLPLAPAPVGPGSRALAARAAPPFSVGRAPLPMQRVDGERAFARHDSPRHYPRNTLVARERVLLWAAELPPAGTIILPVIERRSRARAPDEVTVREGAMRNGHLTIWHDPERGLCLSSGDVELTDVLGVETVGDRGDLYTHSPIAGTERAADFERARVTMRGPLRGELTLEARVPVAPRQLRSAAGEELARPAARTRIRARVQLDAGAAWCRVLVDGVNAAPDHRARIVLRTGCRDREHRADAALGVVTRRWGAPDVVPGDVESLPPTAPLHRFVSLFDRDRAFGVTVISDGLGEYEARADGGVAITLVRAVGELSRPGLPERPGHAGWPHPAPLAQSLGPFEAAFAVFCHGPDTLDTRALVEWMSDDVLCPASGSTVLPGAASERVQGLALEGPALAFLCAKRSDDERALIARCRNLGAATATGAWHLEGLTRAWLARLDETPIGALTTNKDRVRFEVPPHAVSTIRLARE